MRRWLIGSLLGALMVLSGCSDESPRPRTDGPSPTSSTEVFEDHRVMGEVLTPEQEAAICDGVYSVVDASSWVSGTPEVDGTPSCAIGGFHWNTEEELEGRVEVRYSPLTPEQLAELDSMQLEKGWMSTCEVMEWLTDDHDSQWVPGSLGTGQPEYCGSSEPTAQVRHLIVSATVIEVTATIDTIRPAYLDETNAFLNDLLKVIVEEAGA